MFMLPAREEDAVRLLAASADIRSYTCVFTARYELHLSTQFS